MRTTYFLRALLVTLAGGGLVLLAVPAQGDSVSTQLAEARQATAAFHSTDNAAAAGWADSGLPCFDSPSGGMGFHWLKAAPTNARPSAANPQALVYEPEPDGSLQLVAVEYLVDRDTWTGPAPTLYGQTFQPIDVGPLHLYELHAYLWRPNPDGMFADYNPRVRMCP